MRATSPTCTSTPSRARAGGSEPELASAAPRGGRPGSVAPYRGARGPLAALREGDLAYLHVHPIDGAGGEPIAFATEFPTDGRYRLFLQFQVDGRVETAAFTRAVGR